MQYSKYFQTTTYTKVPSSAAGLSSALSIASSSSKRAPAANGGVANALLGRYVVSSRIIDSEFVLDGHGMCMTTARLRVVKPTARNKHSFPTRLDNMVRQGRPQLPRRRIPKWSTSVEAKS
eukprot:9025405-Pyramimonas_sp.AAC.1